MSLIKLHSLPEKEAAARMSEIFCQDHARLYRINTDSAQGDPCFEVESLAQYCIGWSLLFLKLTPHWTY